MTDERHYHRVAIPLNGDITLDTIFIVGMTNFHWAPGFQHWVYCLQAMLSVQAWTLAACTVGSSQQLPRMWTSAFAKGAVRWSAQAILRRSGVAGASRLTKSVPRPAASRAL